MKGHIKMKRILTLPLLPLLVALTAGCAQAVTNGLYTLHSGETLPGNLVITSGQVTLEQNSRVNGSVFMTSGNLDANGEIGDICAWQTKTVGSYTVQLEWSNKANACV